MKIFTRIATAVTAAIASVFIAAPAFASTEGEKIDFHAMYSTAGNAHNMVAISIVMLVLLAVVLLASTGLGNLFEKKKQN
ncbi:hypothetical protein ICL81_02375 [Leucobacter sp. cx-328]|uniref:hypothetical protein n=1 Tax=unclassified Leucobacter TaxID=2621730 RepID=UPI00165D5EB5|nr:MULTISPECIES: hypothetical protein [unclassified Leucobacter]MBC9943377.1 hypothetical protein [Leucobacter sp. cx-328]